MADEKFTRCPGCKTVFRVTDGQLALRDGQVRCGHCRTVFDGRAELISLAPPPADQEQEVDELALGPPTVTLRSARALDPPPPPASSEAAPAIDYENRFSDDRKPSRLWTTLGWIADPGARAGPAAAGGVPLPRRAGRAPPGDQAAAHARVRTRRLRRAAAARCGRAVDRSVGPAGRSRAPGPPHPDGDDPQSRAVRDRLSPPRTDAHRRAGPGRRAPGARARGLRERNGRIRRPESPAMPKCRSSSSSTQAPRRRQATGCTCSSPDLRRSSSRSQHQCTACGVARPHRRANIFACHQWLGAIRRPRRDVAVAPTEASSTRLRALSRCRPMR